MPRRQMWRPPIRAALSRPLHASRGHLQSSSGLPPRWPSHLSLARFRSPQRTETHDPPARRILAPFLTAYPSARLCAHPPFRLPGQPHACLDLAPLLSLAGPNFTTVYPVRACPSLFHRHLALPQLRWAHGSGRKVRRCRNPISLPTRGRRSSMNRLSPAKQLPCPPSALHL
jgi:hypothetical protein